MDIHGYFFVGELEGWRAVTRGTHFIWEFVCNFFLLLLNFGTYIIYSKAFLNKMNMSGISVMMSFKDNNCKKTKFPSTGSVQIIVKLYNDIFKHS